MKKLIAVIIAVCMILGVCACTAKKAPETKTEASAAPVQEEVKPEEAPVQEEVKTEEAPVQEEPKTEEPAAVEEPAEGTDVEIEAAEQAETEENEGTAFGETKKVGGWELTEGMDLPEDAQEALDKALAEYVGMTFEPLALLGTQIVAGTNYKVLAAGTPVVPDAASKLVIVTVYKDLEGNAKVIHVQDVELSADAEADPTISGAAGGWNLPEIGEAELPAAAQKALEDVTGRLMGCTYSPVKLVATQLVAGTNYCILCETVTVTAEPVYGLSLVFIYADLQGNAQLLTVQELLTGMNPAA